MTVWWSLNYVVAKFALREFPALLASGVRMVFAGALMFSVYWYRQAAGTVAPWSRADLKKLIFLGMVGVGLNQFFFVVGISLTTVSHGAIMIGLSPILVLLLASAARLEKLTTMKLLGMFTAFSGVAVLQLSASKANGASLVGDILVFCAGLTFAIYTVSGKRQTAKLDGVVVNTFAYVGTAVAMLPITIAYSVGFDYSRITWVAWASLVYMAVFPSVICYSIYYYALGHVPASRVAAFSYLQPVLATTMAMPLLGEHLTKSLIMGGALVLTGVFLAERG
jgi:drug/metabolite transporter (DMT)-like permease